jgi:hypothetical protein
MTSAISSNRNIQYGSSRLSELSTTDSLGKWRAYSLCGSMISVRNFGRCDRHFLISIDTAVVLPTPVEPITAKWRVTSSSTLTAAARAGILGQRADRHAVGAAKGVDRLEIVGADAMGDGAERGIGANAAEEPRRAVVVVDDLAAQLHLHVGDVGVGLRSSVGRSSTVRRPRPPGALADGRWR